MQAASRPIITFDSGTVHVIALKYQVGKQVSNGRIMFSTVEGEVFFLDPDDADKIYELKLGPQEKFRLIRRGNSRTGVIEVSKIGGEQPAVRPAAPVAVMPVQDMPVQQQTPQQPQGNSSLSGIMASSYIAAIDALLVARDYAESKGIPFRLSMGELRSAAHCIFIQAGRLQERKSWQQ